MDIKRFTYLDAHYSYVKLDIPPSGEVISYGKIISSNDKFTDIQVAWSENPDKVYFGIVIPKGFFLTGKSDINLNFSNGNKIAIYWNDIFAYNEDYDGPHKLSEMYTEGIFVKVADNFIIIDNPETINFNTGKNHPIDKPKTYCIPINTITSIKKYE